MPVIRKRKVLAAEQKKTIKERLIAGRKAKTEGINNVHKKKPVNGNKSKKITESANQQSV
jgi:hypothetical protein